MERELGREGPGRIHLKFGAGGLVDVEFLVQVLQLTPRRAPRDAPDAVDAPRPRAARRARAPAGGHRPRAPGGLRVPPPAPAVAAPRPGAAGRLSPDDGPRARAARAGGGPGRRPGAPRAPPRGGGVRARGVSFGSWEGTRERAAERFYLVDGPSYLYRAYHAIGHLSTSRGLPTNATLGMTMMLWKLLREDQPSYMGIAWDAPGPTAPPPAVRGLQAPAPRDAEGPRRADPVGPPVVRGAGPPARSRRPGTRPTTSWRPPPAGSATRAIELVLVTADKDALQLVDPRVTVLSVLGRTGERVVYDAAKVEEKWGVPPARIPDVLALMGDSIDNIPGVPGVGEVTAQKLLREFGSLEALYANLAVVTGPKLRETLARHRDQAFLSRQLAVLEGALPIEFDLERFRVREPEWERLRALWTELEFSTLLRQIPARAVTLPAETVPVVDAAGWRDFLARAGGAPRRRARPRGERAGLHPPRRGGVRAGGRRRLPRGLAGASRRRAAGGARHEGPRRVGARRGGRPGRGRSVDDTAVAAYLLNSGRSGYPLDQLCAEAGSPPCPERSRPSSAGRRRATRTRRGSPRGPAPGPRACGGSPSPRRRCSPSTASQRLYETLEVPLVPILADMERVGIRVDPGAPRPAREGARHAARRAPPGDPPAGRRGGQPELAEAARGRALREAEAAAASSARRRATRPTWTCWRSWRSGTRCPGRSWSTASSRSSRGRTRTPCRRSSIRGRAASTPRSTSWSRRRGGCRSSNPNLQNIPIRSELGRRIRQAFIPDDGWRFVAADYSQIELRILAHFSEEPALVEAFQRGEDIHTRTAAQIMGAAPEAVTSEMRRLAKVVNFGILYGLSGFGLSQAVSIGRAEAQRFIDDYFATHPRVRAYIDRVVAEGRAQGYVTTLLGRRRYLPGARRAEPRGPERRRADGGQRADPGHRVRHHQAGDGAPGAGARRAGAPEPDAAPGPRRAPPRGAGGRGGGRARSSCPRSWRPS